MGKTRDLFKKIRDTKGTFHAKMGSNKDRNGMDLTEAENIKKRWQEYSRGSSWPRDQTWVFCIAGRFLTTEPSFSSVQLLSHVRLFATPWIAARQASLSITNSWSSLRLTSIESVMPFSHLILCRPLLLLPPIPPSIRVFSKESTLHMRWPKYWSFSFYKLIFIKCLYTES